jgi:uncharacterized protein YbbC (DUF1343 family)
VPEMSRVITGLERLGAERRSLIAGRRVGLVAHPASVTFDLTHAIDVVLSAGANVEILFGPEHGFCGEAQDMESVDGAATGPRGIPLHSLYGSGLTSLSPPDSLVAPLDALVVDLADVGSRYYTFVWTAVLCLRVCQRLGVELILLDRPNPLGGDVVEGAPQRPGFLSFVGLHPVPNRHGLTLAEIVRLAADADGTGDALIVVPMEGWRRGMTHAETGLPWIMPSPNMPCFDTALVYPGGCLLEATWASEGRGTTRPFELVGAPGIDGRELAAVLDGMALPGVRFRPASFRPTFHKHAGRSCGGVQAHVTDAAAFRPYLSGVGLLLALSRVAGDAFEWRTAPYEFVTDTPAIDLLAGSPAVREGVDSGAGLPEIAATWSAGEAEFIHIKRDYHLY